MTERSVAIIGKGMIGISMAVLFTGNGIPTIVLAKNAEVGLEKYRTYYRDLVGQGLVTERQAAACERRLSFTESYQDLADVERIGNRFLIRLVWFVWLRQVRREIGQGHHATCQAEKQACGFNQILIRKPGR